MDDETFLKVLDARMRAIQQTSLVDRRTLIVLPGKAQVGIGSVGTTGNTVFSPPRAGTIWLRMQGAGVAATVRFSAGGDTYTLNNGAILTAGAFYEFAFKVGEGEVVAVVGSDRVTAFFTPE